MRVSTGSSIAVSLLTLVLAGGSGLLSCRRSEVPNGHYTSERPNIVLIIIDTLRADKLSSWGYPRATSPEIDALAARGVRFDRAFSQCSWTRPSIGSLLTSQYPRTLGIYVERGQILPSRFVTLAEQLHAHGYVTLGATANPNINSYFNFQQGFDGYADSDVVWPWMTATRGYRRWGHVPLRTAPEVFEQLTRMVEGHQKEAAATNRPFYLQADVMEVHEWQDARLRRSDVKALFAGAPDRAYLQAIRQVSEDVGSFVRELSARPGWEDTLFVITADHGEGLTSHPHVPHSLHHGRLLYETETHVPLVLYDTSGRLPRGLVVKRSVRLIDLMPTLLAYAHVPGPEGMVGVSLLPLLEGRPVAEPDVFVMETHFRGARKIAAYSAHWKYIENRDHQPGVNPRELQVMGGREDGRFTDMGAENPEIMRRLAGFLHTWERQHPEAPPTHPARGAPDSTIEQLRSLGYVP